MNSFDTLDELWLDAAEQLYENGHHLHSRDGDTCEVLGYVARLGDPRANFMFNPGRNLNASYAAAETLWYLSGHDSIDMIKAYAPQYERFANDGAAHGAYGNRWEYCNQLSRLIQLLTDKDETRQAVITIWNPCKPFEDLDHAVKGDKKDLPCTLSMNFIVRDEKLNLVVTMRSNDVWLGLPYDVFAFTIIQQLIARCLCLELGFYQHQATSLHVYQRNHEAFERARNVAAFDTGPLKYSNGREGSALFKQIARALETEKWNRQTGVCTEHLDDLVQSSILGQLVVMASHKFNDLVPSTKRIENKLLKEHMKKQKRKKEESNVHH